MKRTLKDGAAVIADFVTRLPNAPGVYRMINEKGDVLYVGKARALKKRVASYTRPAGLSTRIIRMVQATTTMEFVTTKTETEALLLEANLIKRFHPPFNVLLRDDKSFPYILISDDHDAAQLTKHRGARQRKGQYFGPFAAVAAVDRTIIALQKSFLLRSCTDSVYESRTRPCLLYQIKRCSAPCTGEISLENYGDLVQEASEFLRGKSSDIKQRLANQMEESSSQQDYERAAIYRDRLASLAMIQSRQDINLQSTEEADVFAIHQEGGQACVQVFFFRTGQNWGNRAYFPRVDKTDTPATILSAFLGQFYDGKPCPRLILLNEDFDERELLAQALSEKNGHKIVAIVPKRGEKRAVVKGATDNARRALERKLAESSTQIKLLEGVKEAFGLEETPKRIEVYDNSHIMGTNAVGGMVVAGPEGFVKGQYRKFNIKDVDIEPGDDYGMMREVLRRRFTRLIKEQPRTDNSTSKQEREHSDAPLTNDDAIGWPDLVLIDGGKGQLSAVVETFAELGVEGVPLVGIAKGVERDAGRERFFMPKRETFMLPERDPVLYFVQRLRDEAHRFAIGTHRARRKKDMIKNPLDEIAGIGPARKRALLQHFGTAKVVKRAGMDDLMEVDGINEHTARLVYNFFHENSDDA
ncbi:MAG: excinuclease ABC subunit UvrC [Hyphomicrobiales bacterium]